MTDEEYQLMVADDDGMGHAINTPTDTPFRWVTEDTPFWWVTEKWRRDLIAALEIARKEMQMISPEQLRLMIMRRIAYEALRLAERSDDPAIVQEAGRLRDLAAKVEPRFFNQI